MVSHLALVETDQIGENVIIKEYVVIRKNVIIGKDVIIHPFVIVEEGVMIGDSVEIFPGSYIGKTPKGVGALARPVEFETNLTIGEGSAIGPHAVIYYDVEIGAHSLVGDGASIREGSRIGSHCVIGRHVTVNYQTKIGDYVKVMDHTWLAGNMKIGNNIFISGGVLTANDNNMGAAGYQEEEISGPVIRDGARIGAGAILLPGIEIGAGSVIAAGAVVTHDVAPRLLMMGVPAKIIRDLSTLEKLADKDTGED
jgi:acetyltransferase-like isoleucine patch superfamily enzyme